MNINETFRTELWFKAETRDYGSSWIIENSDLLGEVYLDRTKHYMILTEDEVIEIVCAQEPIIEKLPDADKSEEIPGKSIIFYIEGGEF